jgi:hypothetical protein
MAGDSATVDMSKRYQFKAYFHVQIQLLHWKWTPLVHSKWRVVDWLFSSCGFHSQCIGVHPGATISHEWSQDEPLSDAHRWVESVRRAFVTSHPHLAGLETACPVVTNVERVDTYKDAPPRPPLIRRE